MAQYPIYQEVEKSATLSMDDLTCLAANLGLNYLITFSVSIDQFVGTLNEFIAEAEAAPKNGAPIEAYIDTLTLEFVMQPDDGTAFRSPFDPETKQAIGGPLTAHGVTYTRRVQLHVNLWANEDGLIFFIGKARVVAFNTTSERDPDWPACAEALNARNVRLGLRSPLEPREASELPTPLKAPNYPIPTSSESDAIMRAMADGRTGRFWCNNTQAGTRIHQAGNAAHYVKLSLTEQEGEFGLAPLVRFTDALDADGTFALMYVSSLLAPPSPLPPNTLASGWIDLDDVAAKIWPAPRSTKEREERRAAIYRFLQFGERAEIIGKRTTTYKDRHTGEDIPTRIDGPIWRFMDKERPANLKLFPSDEIPLRVELAVSREWSRLTSHPDLAQYLPLGELLGAIPGSKTSGAWARTIGLTLANSWRREPRSTVAGTLKLSRRELLDRYEPKMSPPREILVGNTPARAITYWREALAILADAKFLAKEGEAALTEAQMKKDLPRYNWQDAWLNGLIDLRPGPAMMPALEDRSASLPDYRPSILTNKKQSLRPRKKPASD